MNCVNKCDTFNVKKKQTKQTKIYLDERGVRTLASEETTALTWRLRPLGHLAY
jgi:hypothetical protein